MTVGRRFTRRELCDLVWSEPMKILAAKYEISDVGLSKVCRRAGIPVLERGYWARRQAEKKTFQKPLPPREPGVSDEMEIGGGDSYRRYSMPPEEEILLLNPVPPRFEEDIAEVTERVRSRVGRVKAPKTLDEPHRLVARLLQEDEARREKQRKSSYPSSWDAPLFESPFEQRRLRILHALFYALERLGAKPCVSGRDARELGVQVGGQHVGFSLDAVSRAREKPPAVPFSPKPASGPMRLAISPTRMDSDEGETWEDAKGAPLEKRLAEVVLQLIVAGEMKYRGGLQYRYEYEVQRKAELEEEIRRRKEEAERKERERLLRLERERVERLLNDADSLRRAEDIRAYVAAVREICAAAGHPAMSGELEAWTEWALAQAERIDPVRSGRFRESMKDPT